MAMPQMAMPMGQPPPGVLEQLVSRDQAGRLIGRGGAGMRELRARCRAQIKIANEAEPGSEWRKLTISGTMEEVRDAISAVLDMLSQPRT